jgi:RNA polymerase sigma factor (sigma-70 family)
MAVEGTALPGMIWSRAAPAPDGGPLVRRLAAGDGGALQEVWRLHGRAIAAYVRHFTADPALRDEVLQETLIAAWRGAARFGGRSSLRTWLCGIARRQALAALRRRGQVDGGDIDALPSPAPGPEALAEADARRAEIAAALRRLSPRHREVLILTFVEGLSYAEMARVLEVPAGTVKSRLFHARRALRALLEEERP